ncbi:MAG: DNA polymerase III subunit [Oscillospiraceae bacterium]|nr:DNA polymerase III subunit [Oscillospiraceae bacterium]
MTQQRISHAYMLVGPEGEARDSAARRLAATMLCSEDSPPCGHCRNCRKVFSGIHPDVTLITRQEGTSGLHREILVEQIRAVAASASVAPNEAARKVYIIAEADRMNRLAQNALLKVLEEPPGHACFILCTAAADALLETVRSRCIRVDEWERGEAACILSPLATAYLQTAASGDRAEAVQFCMLRAKLTREETEIFLEDVRDALWAILCNRAENPGLSQDKLFALNALVDRAEDYLRHNVAPKQIFGMLAAETLR